MADMSEWWVLTTVINIRLMQEKVWRVAGHFAGMSLKVVAVTSGPFTLDGGMTANQWHCTDIRSHMRKCRVSALEKSKALKKSKGPLAGTCSNRNSQFTGIERTALRLWGHSWQGTNTMEGVGVVVRRYSLRLPWRTSAGATGEALDRPLERRRDGSMMGIRGRIEMS